MGRCLPAREDRPVRFAVVLGANMSEGAYMSDGAYMSEGPYMAGESVSHFQQGNAGAGYDRAPFSLSSAVAIRVRGSCKGCMCAHGNTEGLSPGGARM